MKELHLFIADYAIWNSPSIINLMEGLTKHYDLLIFISNTDNRNIQYLKQKKIPFYLLEKIPFKREPRNIYYQLRYLYNSLFFAINQPKADIAICVDAKGFYQYLQYDGQAKPIYYSLELQLLNEEDPDDLYLPITSILEKTQSKMNRIQGVMIQSDARKKAFYEGWHLAEKLPYCLIPVTYQTKSSAVKSNYIREKYQIPDAKKILLHMGGVHPYYKTFEIVNAVKNTDLILFIHGCTENQTVKMIKSFLIKNQIKNVIFSVDVFQNMEDANIIYQSADYGIAWYEYTTKNFQTAAFSSGKLAGYLQFGLPIIVNKGCDGGAFVEKFNCGVAVNDFSEILPSISQLNQNGEVFSENGRRAYDQFFQFNHYRESILQLLES